MSADASDDPLTGSTAKTPPTEDVPSAGTVGILLATFNGESYLAEQLDSIAHQTYADWSLIVADDGSSDGTLDIVRTFADRHPGRVRVLTADPVRSAKDNFFRLLLATPEFRYVALCDQDDRWDAEKLEVLVGACRGLEERGRDASCLVHSDLRVVDADLAQIASSFMSDIRSDPRRATLGSALIENYVPGCSMLMNWTLVERFREYGTAPKEALMHDWWLLLIALTMGEVAYVSRPLVDYRQHSSNAAGSVRRHGLAFIAAKLRRRRDNPTEAVVRQAGEFVHAYGTSMSPAAEAQLAEFSRITELNKFRRIQVCLRLGILKQTASRRIYQLITI